MAKKPIRTGSEAVTPAAGLRRTKVGAAGKSHRVKSAAELAELLSVSRGTITKWIRDGMPFEGDEPGPGKPYMLDVGVVVRWLQERAANEAREDEDGLSGAPADGGESYEDAKTRKERALADAAESNAVIQAIAEAKERGLVAPIATMHDTMRQEYASLCGALAPVGKLVETRLRRATPERIGREVDTLIRAALQANLKGDIEAAMEVDETPEVEPRVGR